MILDVFSYISNSTILWGLHVSPDWVAGEEAWAGPWREAGGEGSASQAAAVAGSARQGAAEPARSAPVPAFLLPGVPARHSFIPGRRTRSREARGSPPAGHAPSGPARRSSECGAGGEKGHS